MSAVDVLVVGSGASGVHFARQALAAGRRVTMVDVGVRKPRAVLPEASFLQLKTELEDPWNYFLGRDNEALILPGNDDEYYGFPPSKSFVFRDPSPGPLRSRGFEPLFSFARGGLAEAWTGGSYPFNDEELSDWPFGLKELLPHYGEVAKAIGIGGARDDLAAHMPLHEGLLEPVPLDHHASSLLEVYGKKKKQLQARSFVMGRARLAVLSTPRGERGECRLLGRCLWGCPNGALYTPAWTLRELLQHPRFDYRPGLKASHFELKGGRAQALCCRRLDDGGTVTVDCGKLVIAAGTLESARLLLTSVARDGETPPELGGLMDNRQVLMPFVSLKMLGRPWQEEAYQYHQLAMGLVGEHAMDYVHGLVTTLKSALIHPVVQSLPFSLGTSMKFFREMHGALGLVNINFSDRPRPENRVALEDGQGEARLVIDYHPERGEEEKLRRICGKFRRILKSLGCLAPRGMTHVRPMGASVHYSGTLPMKEEGDSWTLTPGGRCRAFDNVWFVDGSGLPSLPAKNLTFTLMANASRIAAEDFS